MAEETGGAEHPVFAYIDAVRGYAILLVITCHLTFSYPELPYPVHRLTVLGWHGVQLFFLASCVTLLLSWHGEVARRGRADIGAFFLRRVFRILPAYYLGGLFYWWLDPPAHGFDLGQFLTAYGFINLWHPLTAPTVMGQWSVIPGGWSVSVEFTFYALFPLIASLITSLRRAIVFTLAALLFAILTNRAGFVLWGGSYSMRAVEDILYFWFPNQLPVFALGTMVFFLLRPAAIIPRHLAGAIAGLALAGFFALAWAPVPQWAGEAGWPLGHAQAASLPLALFVLALSRAAPGGLFVNPLVAWVGKISFSAYLIHYAAIELLPGRFPHLFHTGAGGLAAILAYAGGWLAVTGATCLCAFCTYHAIERPMIALGRRLINARRARLAALAAEGM
ncbi:MAG: acyltransferase family protein [Acidibrevibacterium sp.]|uniref:acyltransferase family protein n=1 Tax=Acidibrevibacterium sp. TaxID=2606776 RepID=UPI003D01F49D